MLTATMSLLSWIIKVSILIGGNIMLENKL